MFNSLIDAKKLKLKIDRIVVGKQGRAVMWTKDKQQVDTINNEIREKNIQNLIVREPKQQLYKVCIDGVYLDEKDDYKTLNQTIVEFNEELEITADDLKPLFASKNSPVLIALLLV